MPIYEYQCKACGRISEFLEGVNQETARVSAKGRSASGRKCKYCGSKELSKVFSKSFVSTGAGIIGSQGGTTCCGRTERCERPPCSDDGICKR
jgi:putative FmdB family regulatory protein